MRRSTLKQVIRAACARAGTDPEDTERLVASADGIDRVAIGAFQIIDPDYGCGCPATVAGYYDPETHEFRPGTPDPVLDFPAHFDSQFSPRGRGGYHRSVFVFVPDPNIEYVKVED